MTGYCIEVLSGADDATNRRLPSTFLTEAAAVATANWVHDFIKREVEGGAQMRKEYGFRVLDPSGNAVFERNLAFDYVGL